MMVLTSSFRLSLCVILAFFALPVLSFHDPISAATGLITRILGADAVGRFQLETIPVDPVTGRDVFEIDSSGSLVVLRGNTGVALATALNNFLKYSLNVSVSWGRDGSGIRAPLPPTLPLPTLSRTVFQRKWTYSWNVCTPGYSFVWYDITQWQFMIDWMAMQGVNLPLAFNGQERVFFDVFLSLGLTEQEIWAYFSGPAFLPWNRMGNIQAWGALNSQVRGLDDGWLNGQYALQLNITRAMRAYGMTPVLPGFAGHVPAGLKRIFPHAQFTQSADWFGFNKTLGSVTLLEPTDPVYLTVGTAINKAILAAFGDPSGDEIPVINADTFNEMKPGNSSLDYLRAVNVNMYATITAADSRAIYLMQGWLFLKGFWTYERTQAFLSGVPIGGMLILDLFSDGAPQWNKYDSFFGHHWIWNSLIVFGGRRGLYGSLDSYASSPYIDRNTSAPGTLVGVGITPEAIDMSQPMFDITLEAGWRAQGPDPLAWLQSYAVRRYGGESPAMIDATNILYDAAYANHGIDASIIEDVPGSNTGSRNTNATGILAALRLFVTAFSNGGGLDSTTGPASYDLVDLTRQALCNLFQDVYGVFSARATRANVDELTPMANALLGLIFDVDTTDAGDVNFLLGPWLSDAAKWGFNDTQVSNRLFNARNQITLWGPGDPNGEINDYAAKVGWAGLVKDYYGARWTSWTSTLLAAIATNSTPDWNTWAHEELIWEQAWSVNSTMYPTTASGVPPLTTTNVMLSKYFNNGEFFFIP
jgi:alpha-N-acetylglucosaminidase